jgi:hypothetical protein
MKTIAMLLAVMVGAAAARVDDIKELRTIENSVLVTQRPKRAEAEPLWMILGCRIPPDNSTDFARNWGTIAAG